MNKILAALIIAAFFASFSGHTYAQTGAVTKNQVDKFMKVNRSNLLVTYACADGQSASSCSATCSSGGSILIEANNVQRAYYAERLNRIDGALAGFFLILDVKDSEEDKDVWATLQTESSCYFKGLSPNL